MPPKGATVKMAEWADWKTEFYVQRSLKKLGHKALLLGVEDSLEWLQEQIQKFKPDMVFNLLEEYQGEALFEAHIVSYLELLGIPYTGCNPQGLSLGRDKALSKKILKYHGIPAPQFFKAPIKGKYEIPEDMKFPMIVKSLNEEASLGISQKSVVNNHEKLKERINFIHNEIGTSAIVEEYIPGREFYVGVIGNKNLKVLPPWELSFGKLSSNGYGIATRNVKFNKKYCERHKIQRGLVKNLSRFTLRKIENLSRGIYQALHLSGYARLDFRLTDEGDVFFLEANPNAELARKECLANAAQHAGLDYDQLIAKIISLGQSYQMAA